MRYFATIALLCLFCNVAYCNPVQALSGRRASAALSKIVLENGYDRKVRPENKVNVKVSTYLIKQYDYREKDQTFAVDLYFRQTWTDSRLASTAFSSNEFIHGGSDISDLIWKPDTFMPLDTSGRRATGMISNIFIRIYSNGTIFYSSRYTLRAQCSKDISRYPRDIHNCAIDFESYGHNTEVIEYEWMHANKPVGYDESYVLPGFSILELKPDTEEISLSSGRYSRLMIKWTIVRNSRAIIFGDLVPSALAAVLSFVPLFMTRRHPHARLLAGTIMVAANLLLIRESTEFHVNRTTFTAADCYRLTNLVFVGLGYLLLAWTSIRNGAEGNGDFEKVPNIISRDTEHMARVNRMGSLILFALYGVFNIVYWLNISL